MWVREMDSRTVHKLAYRLWRLWSHEGISDKEEWLLEACISELEYRQRNRQQGWRLCGCQFCCTPFPDVDPDDGPVITEPLWFPPPE